jgi:hypothetical protein
MLDMPDILVTRLLVYRIFKYYPWLLPEYYSMVSESKQQKIFKLWVDISYPLWLLGKISSPLLNHTFLSSAGHQFTVTLFVVMNVFE